MRTALVLFTRDLRVHDHPALAAAAAEAERVVPLFVLDPTLLERFGAPNRVAFLLDALHDLGRAVRERGGALVMRHGDVVQESMRVAVEAGAEAVFVSEDVSAYAQARERRLREACATVRLELRVAPGITIVPPGDARARRLRSLSRLHALLAPLARCASPARAARAGATGGAARLDARPPSRPRRAVRRHALARPPKGWRDGGPETARAVAGRRPRRVRPPPRRPRGRPYVAAQPVSPLRLPVAARGRRAGGRPFGIRAVPPPARVARLLRPAARRQTRQRAGGLPRTRRRVARR